MKATDKKSLMSYKLLRASLKTPHLVWLYSPLQSMSQFFLLLNEFDGLEIQIEFRVGNLCINAVGSAL